MFWHNPVSDLKGRAIDHDDLPKHKSVGQNSGQCESHGQAYKGLPFRGGSQPATGRPNEKRHLKEVV